MPSVVSRVIMPQHEKKKAPPSRPTLAARGPAPLRVGRLVPRKESAASTLFSNRQNSAFSSADDVRKASAQSLRLERDSDSSSTMGMIAAGIALNKVSSSDGGGGDGRRRKVKPVPRRRTASADDVTPRRRRDQSSNFKVTADPSPTSVMRPPVTDPTPPQKRQHRTSRFGPRKNVVQPIVMKQPQPPKPKLMFVVDDLVLWKSEDSDIPRGTVGRVTYVHGDGDVEAIFPDPFGASGRRGPGKQTENQNLQQPQGSMSQPFTFSESRLAKYRSPESLEERKKRRMELRQMKRAETIKSRDSVDMQKILSHVAEERSSVQMTRLENLEERQRKDSQKREEARRQRQRRETTDQKWLVGFGENPLVGGGTKPTTVPPTTVGSAASPLHSAAAANLDVPRQDRAQSLQRERLDARVDAATQERIERDKAILKQAQAAKQLTTKLKMLHAALKDAEEREDFNRAVSLLDEIERVESEMGKPTEQADKPLPSAAPEPPPAHASPEKQMRRISKQVQAAQLLSATLELLGTALTDAEAKHDFARALILLDEIEKYETEHDIPPEERFEQRRLRDGDTPPSEDKQRVQATPPEATASKNNVTRAGTSFTVAESQVEQRPPYLPSRPPSAVRVSEHHEINGCPVTTTAEDVLGPQGPRPSDLPMLKGTSHRKAVGPLTLRVRLLSAASLRVVLLDGTVHGAREPFVRMWTTADVAGTSKWESHTSSKVDEAGNRLRSQRTAVWGENEVFNVSIGPGVPVAGQKLMIQMCQYDDEGRGADSALQIIGKGSFSLSDIRSQANDEIVTLYSHSKSSDAKFTVPTISGNLRISVAFRPPARDALTQDRVAAKPGGALGRKRWSVVAREGAGNFRDDLALWKKVDDWAKRNHDQKGVRQLFRTIDPNGDGVAKPAAVVKRFKKGGLHLNDTEAAQIFVCMDPNNDGTISYGEFNRALRNKREEIKRARKDRDGLGLRSGESRFDADREVLALAKGKEEELKGVNMDPKIEKVWRRLCTYVDKRHRMDGAKVYDIFKEFDGDGNGIITVAELRQALLKSGIRLTLEQFDLLEGSLDTNHEGFVNYKEFASQIMSHHQFFTGEKSDASLALM